MNMQYQRIPAASPQVVHRNTGLGRDCSLSWAADISQRAAIQGGAAADAASLKSVEGGPLARPQAACACCNSSLQLLVSNNFIGWCHLRPQAAGAPLLCMLRSSSAGCTCTGAAVRADCPQSAH